MLTKSTPELDVAQFHRCRYGNISCQHVNAWQRPRCYTCEFINPLTKALKAPSPTAIISSACRKILRTAFLATDVPMSTSVKLGNVNNTPGLSVAQHLNSAGHSITDVQVRGMRLCRGTNILRKQLEMKLTFQLGTVQPDGLNINFKYV